MKAFFHKIFGCMPQFRVTVPSRVNLIGEHIDYFKLPVLPIAVNNVQLMGYITPRVDNQIHFFSTATNKRVVFSLNDQRSPIQWPQYIQGALEQFKNIKGMKNLLGFNLMVDSSIPIGSGLSSSSALTMAGIIAIGITNKFFDGNKIISPKIALPLINDKASRQAVKLLRQLCLMGCQAEWWYGTKGGAMDHFAITVAKENFATLLNNETFAYQYIPLPTDLSIIVCNTNVAHNQLYSQFADRKETAAKAFEKVQLQYPYIKNISHLTLTMLNKVKNNLTELEYNRLRHPITEKVRVGTFIKALIKNDYKWLGRIANSAFLSLKDDYQVSCAELDIMHHCAINSPGCFGARITGGGFGGAIVAFVDKKLKEQFISSVNNKYNFHPVIQKSALKAEIWEAKSSRGLYVMKL